MHQSVSMSLGRSLPAFIQICYFPVIVIGEALIPIQSKVTAMPGKSIQELRCAQPPQAGAGRAAHMCPLGQPWGRCLSPTTPLRPPRGSVPRHSPWPARHSAQPGGVGVPPPYSPPPAAPLRPSGSAERGPWGGRGRGRAGGGQGPELPPGTAQPAGREGGSRLLAERSRSRPVPSHRELGMQSSGGSPALGTSLLSYVWDIHAAAQGGGLCPSLALGPL